MSDTERGIEFVCEIGHTQRIVTPDLPRQAATQLAGLLDGTSPFYKYPPREFPVPASTIGKCGLCETWLTASLFGYDEGP
jgi:hypothetical protein